MFSILEYLCLNSTNTPVTKYHIMTKINAIRQQRLDRINQILNALEEKEYIQSTIDDISNAKLYFITEKGFDAYLKWIKDFLSFVRTMKNNEKSD